MANVFPPVAGGPLERARVRRRLPVAEGGRVAQLVRERRGQRDRVRLPVPGERQLQPGPPWARREDNLSRPRGAVSTYRGSRDEPAPREHQPGKQEWKERLRPRPAHGAGDGPYRNESR